MKFNMGCGLNRMDGFINVDASAGAAADEVWDLETTPWPWADSCADEICFIHALEHMGGDPKVFLAIMQEIYRIAAPGCRVRVHVPHPRHDHFLNDPTHVRPITADGLRLFDRQLNEAWRRDGRSNTPLGLYLGVDFQIVEERTIVETSLWKRHEAGELSLEALQEMIRRQYNVVSEIRLVLEVRK